VTVKEVMLCTWPAIICRMIGLSLSHGLSTKKAADKFLVDQELISHCYLACSCSCWGTKKILKFRRFKSDWDEI